MNDQALIPGLGPFQLIIIIALVWFIVVLVLLPFRVGQIRDQARRQTELLNHQVSILDSIAAHLSNLTRHNKDEDSNAI